MLESSLGRPKDPSLLAESASCCVASGGGAYTGCACRGEAVVDPCCGSSGSSTAARNFQHDVELRETLRVRFMMSDISASRESGTRNIPGDGGAPVLAMCESQRMSTTGVPQARALAYFAPVAVGHNRCVVERLNVGACIIPFRCQAVKHRAEVRSKESHIT